MKQFILFLLVLLPVCSSAQFVETFDGPDINSENTWKGDLGKFVIGDDGWLWLNGSRDKSETVGLNLDIQYFPTMQWEFDVYMKELPSDDNYIRLYLYTESDGTYYYVQIGRDGSKKIRLLTNGKQDLFTPMESGLTVKPILLHIKVTLEDNRVWTMYSRVEGETDFRMEGTTESYPVDNPVDKGPLILNIAHSKTRYKHFAIDNIRVSSQITPDDTTDEETSEELDEETEETDEEEPTDATEEEQEEETEQDTEEDIDETEVEDEETDEEPDAGRIIINEVMADPKGLTSLPETEYVELRNMASAPVTLDGWQFSYGGKAKEMTAFRIAAGGYAVLHRSGRDVETADGAQDVPLDNFPYNLANDGKQLQLLDAEGNVMDEYTYPKATSARSWERSPSGSWHLSSDPRGGTPGAANSDGEKDDGGDEDEPEEEPEEEMVKVEPLEFVFNELLPEPFAGGSEYIELYNRSRRKLPLTGLSVAVRKSDGTLNTRYPLSSVGTWIEPGGYALLTKNLSGVTDFYSTPSPSALFEVAKLPILANTSSTLVLLRSDDGEVIDEVSYSYLWHSSSVKDRKGVALERIDTEAATQSAAGWSSASSLCGYGTPGYRNSQTVSSEDDEDDITTGIETPQWDEGRGCYILPYMLDLPGYGYRAFVFNISGARVAEIARGELLGVSGLLTWDGCASSGSRLPAGVYIFYAELYHSSGTVKRHKQVFLVR